MTVQLSQLRVSADFDASKYVAGAGAKVAADREMAAGARLVDVATGDLTGKIGLASSGIARLSRTYVEGAAEQQKFVTGLRQVNAALETGKLDAQQAAAIYAGMAQKLGLVANEVSVVAAGYIKLGEVVGRVNGQMLATPSGPAPSASPMAFPLRAAAPVNDNNVSYRRQNLLFQLFDVIQGGGSFRATMQQVPQIAQIYSADGGLKGAVGDVASIATRFAPVAVAAGGVALAIHEIQKAVKDATGQTISFSDAAKYSFEVVWTDIKGVASSLLHELQPAIGAVGSLLAPVFKTAIDSFEAFNDAIIGGGKFAYDALVLAWNDFPRVLGDVAIRAGNLFNDGLTIFLNKAIEGFREFYRIINPIAGLADATGNSALSKALGTGLLPGKIDFKPTDNPYKGAAGDFSKELGSLWQSDMSGGWTKGIFGALGQYFDHVVSGVGRLAQQDKQAGDMKQVLHDLTEAMRALQKVLEARQKLDADIAFERSQLFLASGEAAIAQRLRGTGLTLNSKEAVDLRRTADLQEYREGIKNFLSTFNGELISSGGEIGKAFARALLSGLQSFEQKIIDRLGDMIFNGLAKSMGWDSPLPTPNFAQAGADAVGKLAAGVAAKLGGGATLSSGSDKELDRSLAGGALAKGAGGVLNAANSNYGGDLASNIRTLAAHIGASPRDLAAAMHFESGFRPEVWGGAGKRYYGLIQAGPAERAAYGIKPGGSLADQFGGIENFFRARGFKPGMGIKDLYSTINAGSPGHYGASDDGGISTVASKIETRFGPSFAAADRLLGSSSKAAVSLDKMSASALDSSRALTEGLGSVGKALSSGGGAGSKGSGGFFDLVGALFGGVSGSAGTRLGSAGGLASASPRWGFASGTDYAPGGLSKINELGGEIVDLPRGSRVIPHDVSMAMARSAAADRTHVTVGVSIDRNGNLQAYVKNIARAEGQASASAAVGQYAYGQRQGGAATDDRRYQALKRRN